MTRRRSASAPPRSAREYSARKSSTKPGASVCNTRIQRLRHSIGAGPTILRIRSGQRVAMAGQQRSRNHSIAWRLGTYHIEPTITRVAPAPFQILCGCSFAVTILRSIELERTETASGRGGKENVIVFPDRHLRLPEPHPAAPFGKGSVGRGISPRSVAIERVITVHKRVHCRGQSIFVMRVIYLTTANA
jgi:hypothetical protein